MNLVTHTIISIGVPYIVGFGVWAVEVEADAWGNIRKTIRYFSTKEAAEKLKVGDGFYA